MVFFFLILCSKFAWVLLVTQFVSSIVASGNGASFYKVAAASEESHMYISCAIC